MMRTKCVSVRLASLESISDMACKAIAFDGSMAILPKSQVFGRDNDVNKSDAYWISIWILEQKNIQYSYKKCAYFTPDGRIQPDIMVEKHVPTIIEPINALPDETLIR